LSVTVDRTTIAQRLLLTFQAYGYWGMRVRLTHDLQEVPEDLIALAPFVQIVIGDTAFEHKSSALSRMRIPVEVGIYADLVEPHWTIQGRGEQHGILYLQDQIVKDFRRGTLYGLVDFTWVSRAGRPTPAPVIVKGTTRTHGFLIAPLDLELTHERAP
jgi:hypothetical protein